MCQDHLEASAAEQVRKRPAEMLISLHFSEALLRIEQGVLAPAGMDVKMLEREAPLHPVQVHGPSFGLAGSLLAQPQSRSMLGK